MTEKYSETMSEEECFQKRENSSAEFSKARKVAFRLLSMRNYHGAVLQRKLEAKGYTSEVCERVIADCRRLGFVNDNQAILREFRRGYGPRYIEFKLQLSSLEVRSCISREMQREKIGELAKKIASREKAFRTLQRKGFDIDLIAQFFSR